MLKFVVLFMALWSTTAHGGAPSCHSLLQATYWQGHMIESTAQHDIYFLGAGEMGGRVLRFIPHDPIQNSYIRKNYFEETQMISDAIALPLLQEILVPFPNLKVLQVQKQLDSSLFFEDVRGYALDKLPDPKAHQKALEDFMSFLDQVQDLADESGNFLDVARFQEHVLWLSMANPNGHFPPEIDFMLKPDNIIVDHLTGDWVIFDPY